jgi:hypothetical protein
LIRAVFILGLRMVSEPDYSSLIRLQEVTVMVNLLIFIVAVVGALRMIAPLLRIAVRLVTTLIGFTLFITVAILLVIAVLSHGAVI